MTGLREEDSGHYWYCIYHTSGCCVSKPVKFYPVVSLGEPLPWDPLAPFWCLLITASWKPGYPPLAGTPGEVVGNMCPGDSDMHTHIHTHTCTHFTHCPHGLQAFSKMLRQSQTLIFMQFTICTALAKTLFSCADGFFHSKTSSMKQAVHCITLWPKAP